VRLTKAKYLLDHEYKKLVQITDKYMKENPRDCLLIKVAMETGARAQEVLNITIGDLNDGSVYIHGLKGSNDRELPLRKTLYNGLIKLQEKHGEDRVFNISYPRFDQIWRKYRPVEKKLHSLRHTFALRVYKKTNDINVVKAALGHKSIVNTQIYMDYVHTQRELRKAIL
jgi:integrase